MVKRNKRDQDQSETLDSDDSFIDDRDDSDDRDYNNRNYNNRDYRDEDWDYDRSRKEERRIKEEKEKYKKNKKYQDMIRTRESYNIKLEDLLKLNMPMDDLVWFYDHLRILDQLYSDTLEYYDIKMKIYNKYKKMNQQTSIEQLNIQHDDIVTKILKSNHSTYIKGICMKKYMNLNEHDKTEEYYKAINWIDVVLELPITCKPVNNNLLTFNTYMNKQMFGLTYLKEQILEKICSLNNSYKEFICLIGPPGVGKSHVANIIAQGLGLPFEQLSFGSIKDPVYMTGHSSTYVGALPGIFTNILKKHKILNPVILLDEIDKITNTTVSSVLYHILDNTQNSKFHDAYIPEIDLDLSKIFFILSANDVNSIDPVLKNRLKIINISGYNRSDKISIGYNYVFPKILTNLGYTSKDIIISHELVGHICDKTKDEGIRELERYICSICEKIHTLLHINTNKLDIKLSYNIPNLQIPVKLTKKIIDELLN